MTPEMLVFVRSQLHSCDDQRPSRMQTLLLNLARALVRLEHGLRFSHAGYAMKTSWFLKRSSRDLHFTICTHCTLTRTTPRMHLHKHPHGCEDIY